MAGATDIAGLQTERYAFGAQTVQQRGSVEQRLSLNWEEELRRPDGADAGNLAGRWCPMRVVDLAARRQPARSARWHRAAGQIGAAAKAVLSTRTSFAL